ncbi:MAG: Gfo/Idh/MocA family oxidoreductase [Desulfobacteraceae bacterium]|nr:Gfo/Idh/MocA family oxidoreductase [Desulfobacteraceae bacterium]
MRSAYDVGVIGCGYWGPNLIRNFNQLKETNVLKVADLDNTRLQRMKEVYPLISITSDYEEVIRDPLIDIVAIATPVGTHFKFASEALAAGKHVFIEKPLCASSDEGRRLIALAEANGLKLMVGHTFLYTSAVRKMKEIVDSGELGEIYYINSQRLNLGLFQKDINVIWDLAPHDLSIILHLLGREPAVISASGSAHINPAIEDVASVTLHFDDNVVAFVQCSWLDPDKVRRMTVVGSRKMMIYDDIQATEKIRIYDKCVEKPPYYDSFAEFTYSYKYGDVRIPKLDGGEPICTQLNHFVECVRLNTQPITDGHNGLKVVTILEAAQRSIKNHGKQINLDEPAPVLTSGEAKNAA